MCRILKNDEILDQTALGLNHDIINFEEATLQDNNSQPAKVVIQNANKRFILTKPLINASGKHRTSVKYYISLNFELQGRNCRKTPNNSKLSGYNRYLGMDGKYPPFSTYLETHV